MFGDKWGELDTRFCYCALNALSLLGRLNSPLSTFKTDKCAEYISLCRNFDGGFGCTPGGESHAGQVFTCVGALSIAKRLDLVDAELLGAMMINAIKFTIISQHFISKYTLNFNEFEQKRVVAR